jgi:hypothetical protein
VFVDGFGYPCRSAWPLHWYKLAHLDRIVIWDATSTSHTEVALGYNFTASWRYELAGVHAASLALHNFKIGPHSILSYRAELVNMTRADGIVFLEPIGSDAGIIYLAFSVVILTQDSSYLELLFVSRTNLTPGAEPIIRISSPKFDFDLNGGSPHYMHFFQWITGLSDYSNET